MIPKNIRREHIIKAVDETETYGIPAARGSNKHLLEYNGKYYPPKYVISLANRHANGEELSPSEFSGGHESNSFLSHLGFRIIEIRRQDDTPEMGRMESERTLNWRASHDERCPRCKETVRLMLENICGKVERNRRMDAGVRPEAFQGSRHYEKLKEIYKALQNHRGFKEFVKAKSLPQCDFFIPEPGFIVEFDESQHFTLPRKLALELYPDDLRLGFDRGKWISLCQRIQARDNDPPYRDEQRAWYDTLRDLFPTIAGLQPTVRIFAGDDEWCSLRPNSASDVEKFEYLLEEEPEECRIKMYEEHAPIMARIIIADEWNGNPREVRKLLGTVYEKWPKDRKVKFVITCGGFIQFDWPKSVSRLMIGDAKYPNPEAVATLVAEAERSVTAVMNEDLVDKFREVTDYITLGVDSYKEKISITQHHIGETHIELVFVVDLKNNSRYWTGKSYPTPAQQNGLVRIIDMDTHFIDLADIGKVMVLGCHDLTMFNPRSQNAKGWRQSTNIDFKVLARKHRPIYVFQHPHTTVKVRTWQNAWSGVIRALPSVKRYAGAGRYCETDRKRSEWDAMDSVLRSTKCGPALDFVITRRHISRA